MKTFLQFLAERSSLLLEAPEGAVFHMQEIDHPSDRGRKAYLVSAYHKSATPGYVSTQLDRHATEHPEGYSAQHGIGFAIFHKDNRGKVYRAKQLYTDPDWQRKGVATAMYDHVKKAGLDIRPSGDQSGGGKEFWRSYRKHIRTGNALSESVKNTIYNHEYDWLAVNDNEHLGNDHDEVNDRLLASYPHDKIPHIDQVHKYTTKSAHLNNHLIQYHQTGTKPADTFNSREGSHHIPSLDAAITHHTLRHDLHVYAGVGFHPGEEAAKNHRGAVTVPSYTSATLDKEGAIGFTSRPKNKGEPAHVVHVHLKPGQKGLYVGDKTKSPTGNEHEFILPRNTKLKIHPNPTVIKKTAREGYPVHVWHAEVDESHLSEAIESHAEDYEDYRGQHTAPGPEDGSPLHDVTANKTYPEDFYSHKGFQYYSDYGEPHDIHSHNRVLRYRNKPDEKVWIHRAIPTSVYKQAFKDAKKSGKAPIRHMIQKGDWVSISKDYAHEHGKSALNGDYKVASMRVPAKHVFTNGDSIHEWGYHPEDKS